MSDRRQFEVIDLMTGQPSKQVMDQMPAVADGFASRVVALGMAGMAVILATGLSPDIPAPRTGQSSTLQTVEVGYRSDRKPNTGPLPSSFRHRA